RRAAGRARPASSRRRLLRLRLSRQEVAGQVGPERSQYRLGMELHAVDGKLAVADGHHLVVRAGCGDLERIRDEHRGERVVAPGLERLREAFEEPLPVVPDLAGLAVDE